jgi:hypothetical protein
MWLELIGPDHEKVLVRINGLNHKDARFNHGITENVDRAFWEQWVADNRNLATVKKGFIFAHGTRHSTEDHAKEREIVLTKLEPINPITPNGTNPMGITAHVS